MTSFPGLVWCGPVFDPSGYADEGRGLLRALDAAGEAVALRPVHRQAPGFRDGLPEQERRVLDRQLARRYAADRVFVQHHPAQLFFQLPGNVHHVGRTMFETDSIPASFVRHCNQMDELWVPSEFNMHTFRGAGVRVPMYRVPGGIDTEQFSPAGDVLPVSGLRGTVFLAVFEWRLSKGWDVLLRAWADAFAPDDDVTLVLRAYPMSKAAGSDNETVINRYVDTFLEQACGRTRRDVAPIRVLGRTVPGAEMPALYRIASALVAPTRGEGWGRPFMEAMATGLPVIATRWSAHLEFMHDENSLLLDIDGLEPADSVQVPTYQGQRWAMPSVAHLTTLLQQVHAEPGAARAVGVRARTDMVEQWPWSRAAHAIMARLREIRGGAGLVARSAAPRPAGPRLQVDGRFFDVEAGDQDAERAVSALTRTWPHEVRVCTNASAPQRPSRRASQIAAWLAGPVESASPAPIGAGSATASTVHTADASNAARGPELLLTWLHRANTGIPQRGAARRWAVHTGDTVSREVPPALVRVLRDEADEVWVPDEFAFAACLAAGIPGDRLWQTPPVTPPPHIEREGPRSALPMAADTVFLLPALDITQASAIDALLRLWQRVFDAQESVLLLLYAPRTKDLALRRWHDSLIELLTSGRLLQGAPIRVWRDPCVGEELAALVRACDVLLDPLPAAATAAMRRLANGIGCLVVQASPVSPLPDAVEWHVPPAHDGRVDSARWRSMLQAATTATAVVTPQPRDQLDNETWAMAARARLMALHNTPASRTEPEGFAAVLDGEPRVHLDNVRSVTILADVNWHNGRGGGVVHSYLNTFDQHDDVSLVLCLDPEQRLTSSDIQHIIDQAARVCGRDSESLPDITLVPLPLTDSVRMALMTRCDATISIDDPAIAARAQACGTHQLTALTRAAWRQLYERVLSCREGTKLQVEAGLSAD